MTTPPLPRTLAGKLASSHVTIASLVEELQRQQQARADLEAENARLREALEGLCDYFGKLPDVDNGLDELLSNARAALENKHG